MQPLATRALAAALVTGLLAAVPAATAIADPPPVPAGYGAEGIGDDYFPQDGNGGIDVQRYRIRDRYRFGSGRLTGATVVTLRATESVAGFHLDLLLPVVDVRVDGRRVGFGRPDRHELRIDAPLVAGTTHRVEVRYDGRPGRVGWDGERSWLAGRHEVVAMNEPHMAAWWFPANDHPRDKALVDISITAPRRMKVVANGRRISRHEHGHRATTRWRADEPMAPYLAFFAAGDFAVRKGVHRGLPWFVAVSRRVGQVFGDPGARRRAMSRLEQTPQVVDWLSSRLGPYPFSSTGGLVTSLDPGFALENQTRPTYSLNGILTPSTLVHELAHQWFGDSVSVSRWRDVWLNEGAATFTEAWWTAAHGGEGAQQWMAHSYDLTPADSSFWRLEVADPGPDRMFDWRVYERGGMSLQALRHRIGRAEFRTLVHRWLSERREGNGSTEDFEALAEEVSGADLDGFFDAWLHTAAKPARTADNGFGG